MDSPYRRLTIVLAINTVIMFLLTYLLISDAGHFHANINRVYMALVMVAPMGLLMLAVMHPMYEDARRNVIYVLAFLVVFIASFAAARTQTPVGNHQFLVSMIPHHSSAILMCEHSQITDPEIIRLCDEIVRTQREEIAQMETILERY